MNNPNTRPALHIEARPYEPPCVRCGSSAHVNQQAPTYADTNGRTVCPNCVSDLQSAALDTVRRVDTDYRRIARTSPGQVDDARTYLATVAQGVRELLAHYGLEDILDDDAYAVSAREAS